MKTYRPIASIQPLFALLTVVAAAQAGTTDLATAPLSSASLATQVKPNILFVLDDSGSMAYPALPDWARALPGPPDQNGLPTELPPALYQSSNPGFNGIAYNPAVRYRPPVYYRANGTADVSTYPSQNSVGTSGWTAVPNNAYQIAGQGTANLTALAYHYTTVAGEYCTDKTLRTCVAATSASPAYPFPANLRWCNSLDAARAASPAPNTCRATQTDTLYKYPRMPEPHTSKLTINAGGSVTSIKVANREILREPVTALQANDLAGRIRTAINECTYRRSANCEIVGYSASVTGNVITISAPAAAPTTPVVTPGDIVAATPFGRSTTAGENQAPGDVRLTVVTDSIASYPKAATRTDCAAPTSCTYAEEMENYANWWAYYHTRMQAMKTAASHALSAVDETRRVGYMSSNNNAGADFLNISDFNATQKKSWYDKLFAAVPDGQATPLRVALSKAGWLYAGKKNGEELNGVTVTDPVQDYCQKNYTILSTDGYWNSDRGFTLTSGGQTPVGDQDGPGVTPTVDRPQLDGGAPQQYQIVSQITKTMTPTRRQLWTQSPVPMSSTQTLRTRTRPVQISTTKAYLQFTIVPPSHRTAQLQTRTNTRQQFSVSQLQKQTSTLQSQTRPLIQTTMQVQRRFKFGLAQWTDWADVDRCVKDFNSNDQTDCQVLAETAREVVSCTPTTLVSGRPIGSGEQTTYEYVTGKSCRYGTPSGWSNAAAACSPQAESTGGEGSTWVGPARDCRYNASEYINTQAACTRTPASAGSPYQVLEATECRYSGFGPANDWTDPAACADLPEAADFSRPVARQCTVTWTDWVNAEQACTPSDRVGCQYTAWSGWTPDANCSALAADNTNLIARECRPTVTVSDDVEVCTPVPDVVFCAGLSGRFLNYRDTEAGCVVNADTGCRHSTTWNEWTDAASCTVANPTANDYSQPTRECQYTPATTPARDDTCPASAVAASQGSPYTVAIAKTCSTTLGPPEYVSDCSGDQSAGVTPTPDGGTSQCQPLAPATTNVVASCSTTGDPEVFDEIDEVADESNRYVTTHCTMTRSEPIDVDICTPLAPVGCPAPPAATPGTITDTCRRASCGSRAGPPTPDTLADVAQYYYLTDLRTSALDNCAPNGGNGNVCQSADTSITANTVQRMSTYTLGLGASGLMQYLGNYGPNDGGDFASISAGTTADPATGVCSWQDSGACNWPKPGLNLRNDGMQANIDDLWHAAVNGRGRYFSAGDPTALAAAISSALANISTATGSVAAVTVTSPNLTAGNNGFYEVSFEVGVWAGDVAKKTIDGNTGAIAANPVWEAAERLRRKMTSNYSQPEDHRLRTIHTFNPGGTNNLKPFLWENLSTAEQGYLSRPYIDDGVLTSPLSQFCTEGVICLGEDDKASASGENLLKFLRGERSNEGETGNLAAFYRKRSSTGSDVHRPLGDISGSEAVYVQKPPWNYVDRQYSAFKEAQSSRPAMVYVGANDGMLHAFDAETGDESWAYTPSLVLPRLYKLADKNYAHRFTVDGTPIMGDICADTADNCRNASSASVWKTILVGGLNGGGRGYYALDITNPASPKALWEFTNDNLGYTYGNPVITKLRDGTWVVIVASGYNNVPEGSAYSNADGIGRLFILNAYTGTPIAAINGDGTISTNEGGTTTPSGLARITAWANFPDVNNTAERVYGGDLLGNLWRFDINGEIPPPSGDERVYDAQRLVTLRDPDGGPQPITARPELGKVKNQPVVFVGTGKLLGTSDFALAESPQQQSFYAIKDRLTDEAYGNPRELSTFTRRTLQVGTCPANSLFCSEGEATVTDALVQNPGETGEAFAARRLAAQQQAISDAFGATNHGWYIDLPGTAEQSNTDPSLQRGTIVFTTNRPRAGGGCEPKATSFRYAVDYRTGTAIEGTNGLVAIKVDDALATRASVVVLTDDETLYGLTRTDQPGIDPAAIPTPPVRDAARRVSWRELVTE